MRAASGLTTQELAQKLKRQYPRMSRGVVSYAERPSESGVTYTREAAALVREWTGFEKARKADNRRCPIRVQARITEAERRALNNARRVMGHETVNDALVYALRWYIAEAKRRAAVDVAASHDGKPYNYEPSIRAEG